MIPDSSYDWTGAPCLDPRHGDIWWPDEDGVYANSAKAIALCKGCPHRNECLLVALDEKPRCTQGIWGGRKFKANDT